MRRLTDVQWARFFRLVEVLEPLSVAERASRLAGLRDDEDAEVLALAELHLRAPGLRSAAASAPPAGSVVVGAKAPRRYRVDEEVGRGGMGVVLGVWDEALKRPVAMKLLRRSGDETAEDDAEGARRFLEEAYVAARLDHPGIAPVHDVGTGADGTPYFTMKRVRGRSLADVFALAHRGEEGWSTTRAVGLLLKVCETMAYAHGCGVVHRDLKPDNVMVGEFGEVYVMDWGVARTPGAPHRSGSAPAAPTVDGSMRSGALFGTPEYMAPEQAAGPPEAIGPAADVYAAGAMLYQLVGGRPPYRVGKEPRSIEALLARLRSGPPAPLCADALGGGHAELAAIAHRAMAREPSARYATMLSLADDLRSFLEGRVVHAYETGPVAELRKWVLRNRGFAVAGSAALMAVIGGALAVALVQTRARHRQVLESDIYLVGNLREREARLWPRDEVARAEIDAWLGQARGVLARGGEHRERLEAARRSGAGPAERLRRELVVESLGALLGEGGLVHDVERRVEFADRAVKDHAAEWEEAIAAVGADAERYSGLRLEPQLGLVPLGPDPVTGLWEFAHLPTGSVPARGGDGRLTLEPETGVVLVLLSGGRFLLGAQSDNEGAPGFAPVALPDEAPVREVELEPFFLAKHEMTQAQWLRAAGENPSEYSAGRANGDVTQSLLAPVEKVSWVECERVLARSGLVLPTEAQWEYAARANAASLWWTGDDPDDLRGAANLADQAAVRAEAPFPEFVSWDDGYPVTAPVGALRPNPFGLHDIYGNVWEWTRDVEGSYALPLRAGDGERNNSDGRDRVMRGGGCDSGAWLARSAYRYYADEHHRDGFAGLRPAAVLRRDGAEPRREGG